MITKLTKEKEAQILALQRVARPLHKAICEVERQIVAVLEADENDDDAASFAYDITSGHPSYGPKWKGVRGEFNAMVKHSRRKEIRQAFEDASQVPTPG